MSGQSCRKIRCWCVILLLFRSLSSRTLRCDWIKCHLYVCFIGLLVANYYQTLNKNLVWFPVTPSFRKGGLRQVACFVVALVGGLSERYAHDGPGVCLGDCQTESCLKEMDMTGMASTWAMARRRPISSIWTWGSGVCRRYCQTEAYLKDTGMMGLASPCAIA